MSRYAELDAAILAGIDPGEPKSFNALFADTVRALCEALAKDDNRDEFRVLEGRLQALRKAEKIRAIPNKGWIRVAGGKATA